MRMRRVGGEGRRLRGVVMMTEFMVWRGDEGVRLMHRGNQSERRYAAKLNIAQYVWNELFSFR